MPRWWLQFMACALRRLGYRYCPQGHCDITSEPTPFWPQCIQHLSYSYSVKRYSYSYESRTDDRIDAHTVDPTESVLEGSIEYEYRHAEYEYEEMQNNKRYTPRSDGVRGDAQLGCVVRKIKPLSRRGAETQRRAKSVCCISNLSYSCSYSVKRYSYSIAAQLRVLSSTSTARLSTSTKKWAPMCLGQR